MDTSKKVIIAIGFLSACLIVFAIYWFLTSDDDDSGSDSDGSSDSDAEPPKADDSITYKTGTLTKSTDLTKNGETFEGFDANTKEYMTTEATFKEFENKTKEEQFKIMNNFLILPSGGVFNELNILTEYGVDESTFLPKSGYTTVSVGYSIPKQGDEQIFKDDTLVDIYRDDFIGKNLPVHNVTFGKQHLLKYYDSKDYELIQTAATYVSTVNYTFMDKGTGYIEYKDFERVKETRTDKDGNTISFPTGIHGNTLKTIYVFEDGTSFESNTGLMSTDGRLENVVSKTEEGIDINNDKIKTIYVYKMPVTSNSQLLYDSFLYNMLKQDVTKSPQLTDEYFKNLKSGNVKYYVGDKLTETISYIIQDGEGEDDDLLHRAYRMYVGNKSDTEINTITKCIIDFFYENSSTEQKTIEISYNGAIFEHITEYHMKPEHILSSTLYNDGVKISLDKLSVEIKTSVTCPPNYFLSGYTGTTAGNKIMCSTLKKK
jgi:hypothetical protein